MIFGYNCVYVYHLNDIFFLILMHSSTWYLNWNWPLYFSLLIFVYNCIYVYHLNGIVFLILMHPSTCYLNENWPRYKIIIMASRYCGNWYLFAIVYIYVHHVNGLFFLTKMHLSTCHLDTNWMRYKAIIMNLWLPDIVINYSRVIYFLFRKQEWMPCISCSFYPNYMCLGAF